jgi:Ribbon-helix-helix domain
MLRRSLANPLRIHSISLHHVSHRCNALATFADLCLWSLHFLLDIHRHTHDICRMKKRTTVWLPQELIEKLKKLSRKTGAPMAELFRRAVEAYLKRQK